MLSTFWAYLLALAILLWILVLLHKRYNVAQYAYFLRIPIAFALITVALPFAAFSPSLKSIMLNWFDLSPWDFFLVTVLAALNAWALMFQFCALWESTPLRTNLAFHKRDSMQAEQLARNYLWLWLRQQPPGVWPPVRLVMCFGLFAGPILVGALLQSAFLAWSDIVSILMIVAGAFVAYLLWLISRWKQFHRAVQFVRRKMSVLLGLRKQTGALASLGVELHVRMGLSELQIKRAWSFFALAGIVYVLMGFVFHPEHGVPARVPPLAYILLLLIVLSYVGSLLTLLFDRYRIPIVLVIVAVAIVVPNDHYYDVGMAHRGQGGEASASLATPARLSSAGDNKNNSAPVVVVAASGGGITASYWTTVVLSELHRELGGGFSADFVSAVSGGSVGAMYYVAAVSTPSATLQAAMDAASASSLSEVGWGLVYPDLWRQFNIPLFRIDRARAQEERWRRLLMGLTSEEEAWMGRWFDEGRRPILALNATVVETGQRFIFTAYDLFPEGFKTHEVPGESPGSVCQQSWMNGSSALSFGNLFPSLDIPVHTAARLSATFPYVTPVARMNLDQVQTKLDNDCVTTRYHLADGGYFDNWGVATALDYIETLQHPRKVLLVEIRADSPNTKPEPVLPGFAAPVKTMLNVRSSSQVNRNEFAVNAVKKINELSTRGVSLTRAIFSLRQDAPLSWHLSEREIDGIRSAICCSRNIEAIRNVSSVLAIKWDGEIASCHAAECPR